MKKIEEKDDIIEKIEEVKKEKRKLPKDEASRINKRLFANIMIAVTIMIYFILLGLGNANIEQPAFVTDLKVFSITFLVVAVIIFEKSYKKDDGALSIYGIETLVLAIVTLLSVYVNLLVHDKFIGLVSVASFGFAIYYVIKAILIYIKEKKEYIKKQSDIPEIIKSEEPKKVETRLKKSEKEKIKENEKIEEQEKKESIREKMLKVLNRNADNEVKEEKPKKVKEESGTNKESNKKVKEESKDNEAVVEKEKTTKKTTTKAKNEKSDTEKKQEPKTKKATKPKEKEKKQ